MSQFYGSMKGCRGETTRAGSKQSGMIAHIRGWNIGVQIYLSHANGRDEIQVFKTGGSNNPNNIGDAIAHIVKDEKE